MDLAWIEGLGLGLVWILDLALSEAVGLRAGLRLAKGTVLIVLSSTVTSPDGTTTKYVFSI